MRELYNYNAGEILIQKTDLGNRIGQDYYLERSGPTTIIKYTTEQSLDNAVYTLLENMGFHWYGPGENWVVRPDLIYRKTIKGSWKTPSFRKKTVGLKLKYLRRFKRTKTGVIELTKPTWVRSSWQ